MAVAGALRQLLLPTISRRLATGQPTLTGGSTTMAYRASERSVLRSYTTEAAAARQEHTEYVFLAASLPSLNTIEQLYIIPSRISQVHICILFSVQAFDAGSFTGRTSAASRAPVTQRGKPGACVLRPPRPT